MSHLLFTRQLDLQNKVAALSATALGIAIDHYSYERATNAVTIFSHGGYMLDLDDFRILVTTISQWLDQDTRGVLEAIDGDVGRREFNFNLRHKKIDEIAIAWELRIDPGPDFKHEIVWHDGTQLVEVPDVTNQVLIWPVFSDFALFHRLAYLAISTGGLPRALV